MDFEEDFVEEISKIETEEKLKHNPIYTLSDKRSMITTNWKLLHNAKKNQIHFNISKLEKVIDYNSNDRSSINIWNKLQDMLIWEFGNSLFPESLEEFLEFHKISEDKYDLKDMAYSSNEEEEDLPF